MFENILSKAAQYKRIKNYNLSNDFKTNEKILSSLGFRIKNIIVNYFT